ncbi:MAG: phytanoyl-CoA dioxygenase family protein [Lentisphaerales bacterium]|nr:phytanoyl-CoA dioxygenase family protein [Lentisphaerales bacterium]
MHNLSKNHVENLKENGFTIIKSVFSFKKLEFIRNFTDSLIKNYEQNYSRDIDKLSKWYLPHRLDNGVLYDVYQRHKEFRFLAENDELLTIIRNYFQDSFYLYVNSLLYKPSYKDNEVPWHQDFLNKPEESEKIILWVALDSASQKNGCLQVIPKSHKNKLKNWYLVPNATHHKRLQLSKEEEEQSIPVELNIGDAILFSQYLVHSSLQNQSNSHRKAIRFAYKKSDTYDIPRGTPIMMG